MKTFEELEEVVHSINEMEEIFKSVVILACHEKEIERHKELKDRVFSILVQDVHRIDSLCSEGMAECVDCAECDDQFEKFIDRKLAEGKEESCENNR